MSTLYTHCLRITTRDGSQPSSAIEGTFVERFPEFMRTYAPSGSDIFQERKIAQQVYWFAKCGLARIGLAPGEKQTSIVISPQLGIAATLDFTSMYQSFCGSYVASKPTFALSPKDWTMHNSVEACLESYERDAQALLAVVFNALFDLQLSFTATPNGVIAPQLGAQRHMPTLYVQLKSNCQSCLPNQLDVDALIEHCTKTPHSFTVTPPWGDLSFADASVKKWLAQNDYKQQEKGGFCVYIKDDEAPIVISTCISRHAASQLENQRISRVTTPMVMKGSLPSWLTFEDDPDELQLILQALGSVPKLGHRSPTGAAMELAYPHHCRTLYLTFDEDPKSEVSFYKPVPLSKPLIGDVFTLSILMGTEHLKVAAGA